MNMGNFKFTDSQQFAFDQLVDFIRSDSDKVFILKGYAGTGKTTLMKELIDELRKRNENYKLLASTGRAAKILSNATGEQASTIHSMIYKFSDLSEDLDEMDMNNQNTNSVGELFLMFESISAENDDYDCYYYIIDESSMISDMADKNATQAMFGNGRLLYNLINFDSKGKFIFVGDECQLPPINVNCSPALSSNYFQEEYHISPRVVALTDVVRQSKGNDLTKASMKLRNLYQNPPKVKWGKFPLRGYTHIHLYQSQFTLIDTYIKNIKRDGYNSATLLCRSNNQCNIISNLVRSSLGLAGGSLQINDLLLISQNNYITGLMNGDMVMITKIGEREMRAGLSFVYVEMEELFSKKRFTQLLIEDLIFSTQTNLQQNQQMALFIDFHRRMRSKGIRQKSRDFKKMMMIDPYLNAVRAVLGYALTCHKAQGGEWKDVFIDIPRALSHQPSAAAYQWLYTAVTRATDNIHIVDDFYIG